jgi:hypothetical protein
LHAVELIHIRPTSYNKTSSLQLVFGHISNISHIIIFECAIYVLIAPPQRTKMGTQIRLEIYVEFESLSIIKYMESMTRYLLTARFADCHFNESIFPNLGGEKTKSAGKFMNY